MDQKITVINRTGSSIFVGVKTSNQSAGFQDNALASATINPGESKPVYVASSYAPPFDVGYITASGGSNNFGNSSPVQTLLTRNVYPDSIVTITSTVATRGGGETSSGN